MFSHALAVLPWAFLTAGVCSDAPNSSLKASVWCQIGLVPVEMVFLVTRETVLLFGPLPNLKIRALPPDPTPDADFNTF